MTMRSPIPVPSPSIWATIEMNAASRDFDYADYLNIHTLSGCTAAALKPETYTLLCQLLNKAIDLDMSAK